MSMFFRTVCVTSLVASLLSSGMAHANLLANGSFEGGTFTPDTHGVQHLDSGWAGPFPLDIWTPFVGGLFWVDNANDYGISASDGNRSINLYDPFRPLVGVGSLQQTIVSTIGTRYALTFDVGGGGVRVQAAGQSADFFNTGGSGWQHESWTFTANDTTTVVYFQGLVGNSYNLLDNAVLTFAPPVPEPESWAMLLSGLAGLAWQARRLKRSAH
jgi:hypothetical protein